MSTLIFLVAIILLGGAMLVMISGTNRPGGKKFRNSTVNRELVAKRWAEVQVKVARGGESGLSSAVTEADKLFDYVLKESGFPGQTFAERLKRAEPKLSDKEAVWRAHKMRNNIAHEVSYDVLPGQVKSALNGYERGLRDLGALI